MFSIDLTRLEARGLHTEQWNRAFKRVKSEGKDEMCVDARAPRFLNQCQCAWQNVTAGVAIDILEITVAIATRNLKETIPTAESSTFTAQKLHKPRPRLSWRSLPGPKVPCRAKIAWRPAPVVRWGQLLSPSDFIISRPRTHIKTPLGFFIVF